MFVEIVQQMLNGLAIGSVYTLIALGLTVVFGILGIAHFAHGSVAMSGGGSPTSNFMMIRLFTKG